MQEVMRLVVDFRELSPDQLDRARVMAAKVAAMFAADVMRPSVTPAELVETLKLTPYAMALALGAAQAGAAEVSKFPGIFGGGR